MRQKHLMSVMFAAAVGMFVAVPVAGADEPTTEPAGFTSAFTAMATADMVINNDGVATPGTTGAAGTFNYRINSTLEVICYDITVRGITEPYQSPAKTATHIHQAAVGKAGPPRIAFPNPTAQADGSFTSSGCLKGPFTTGITGADGNDTGTNFSLKQIEADPAAFFTDTHTAANPAGAVRGQLTVVPVSGVGTGGGGAAGSSTDLPIVPIGVAVVAIGAFAWIARRANATEGMR